MGITGSDSKGDKSTAAVKELYRTSGFEIRAYSLLGENKLFPLPPCPPNYYYLL